MRILVTGGTGFIGSFIVKHLLKGGHSVRALSMEQRAPDGVELYQADINDFDRIEGFFEDIDYVIHLAAMVGVSNTESNPLKTLNTNIEGTRNVLQACKKHGVKRVVFSSSSEVYGEPTTPTISEANPSSPKSVYGVSKLAGEEYLKAYWQSYGLPFCILRYFNVYGPGQSPSFVIPSFVELVLSDKPITIYGAGEQVRSFCHGDDIANGTLLALFNSEAEGQIFNIGDDREPLSIRELANKIAELCGKEVRTDSVPLETTDRSKREIYRRIPEIEKARQILGYQPQVSFAEGLLEVISHIRNRAK